MLLAATATAVGGAGLAIAFAVAGSSNIAGVLTCTDDWSNAMAHNPTPIVTSDLKPGDPVTVTPGNAVPYAFNAAGATTAYAFCNVDG